MQVTLRWGRERNSEFDSFDVFSVFVSACPECLDNHELCRCRHFTDNACHTLLEHKKQLLTIFCGHSLTTQDPDIFLP